MMVEKLTSNLTKKLLFAIIVLTIGSDLLLYLIRKSEVFGDLYNILMGAAVFIGLSLHKRLRDEPTQQSKTMWLYQFCLVYVLFSLASSLTAISDTYLYPAATEEFQQQKDVFQEDVVWQRSYVEETEAVIHPFFQFVNEAGNDLFLGILAGLEEVWRLGYIILFLLVCKILFKRTWASETAKSYFLLLALFFSSFMFGVGHTLSYETDWNVTVGTVVSYTNLGVAFGLLLLWTRNLWLLVGVHALHNTMTTLSWMYNDYLHLIIVGVFMIILLLLLPLVLDKRKKWAKAESMQIE